MSVLHVPAGQEPDPYEALLTRVKHRLKEKRLDNKILDLVRLSCEEALRGERIILSRVERTRLIQLVSRQVLLELVARL